MAFSFKPTDIKRTCGFQAYQRGIAYWKDNKVLDIKLTDQSATQQIISHVAGSHGEIYTTQIEILEYDEGDCEIIGECTCPVQIDCKHVAATLLKTLQEGPQALTSASTDLVSDWLDSLEAARREPETDSETAPASPYRLLYVLESNPERQDPYAIELVTQKVRLLKKGGYGKPSAFPLEKASETYYANDFLRQEDRDIAQLITNARNYYYYNYSNRYTLKREMGRLALEKILATGRCHWGDKDNPPLRPGDARELRFEWRDMGDGKQLEAVIEPAVSYLFRCEGFWFVDLDQQEAGPLSHPDLDSRQVEALLKAPVVPREQLEDISRKLILELPEYRLTPPVELEIETIDISGHNPKPRLRLMQIDSRTARTSAQGLHCARLSLDYGAVEVREPLGDNPLTQIVDGNRVYRVERDGDAERALFATLRNAGLRLLPTTPDRPRMDWQYETAPGDAASKAAQWDRFISETLPQLEAAGWTIEFDDSFQLRFEESDDWLGEFEESDNDWFSLSLGVELDGQRIDLLPLLVDILKAAPNARALKDHLQSQSAFLVEIAENQYLKIPSARLLPIFDTLVELYDQDPLDEHGKLNLSKQQALQLDGLLNNPTLTWRGAEELMALNRRLRDFSAIQPVPTPAGFNAELREYQQQGLSWLQFLVEYGFSGILADDMGLGKTIQTLAHLLTEKQAGRLTQPALIIAPTSLIANWRREANRFAPDLSVLVLHGPRRHRDFPRIDAHDLIITSYPLIRRDADNYREREFHMIVLDEAQAIKNPKSATTQAIFGLQATHRLCLSGTPVENHLGEFWSIFHFLMPGFLGNLQRFNRLYRNPIEKQQDDIRRDQLARRVRPFVLRRTKDEVASELPEKTEIIRTISLAGQQRDLYESIRLAMDKKVRQEINKKGLARSHIMILDALLKLRQCCCDPRLVSLPRARKVTASAKLEALMTMLPELIEEGRRILLFSQFTTMLGLIETELQARDIAYSKLTGQTRNREAAIARFQDGDVPIFLISLKAGGVGLNLTAADTVIHYDPWWNPAVENQATDRAHRIGQEKAVFVYKLITENTVEDRILALQKKKQALADAIYGGSGDSKTASLTADDLAELFRPLEPKPA